MLSYMKHIIAAPLFGRELFRPKFPEVAQQCASCPFRVGNSREFGEVIARLRVKSGIRGKTTKTIIGCARLALFQDAQRTGDFMCHCSVYDRDMAKRPMSEWRQCAGATKAYRSGRIG